MGNNVGKGCGSMKPSVWGRVFLIHFYLYIYYLYRFMLQGDTTTWEGEKQT